MQESISERHIYCSFTPIYTIIMKHHIRLVVLLLAIFMVVPNAAHAGDNDKKDKEVWAFAYATNFKDSVICLSAIQPIPGAKLQKNGFLKNRQQYSSQFAAFVQGERNTSHVTSALIFAKSRSKAESKYVKMRKRIRKNNQQQLIEIPASAFSFEPVQSVVVD